MKDQNTNLFIAIILFIVANVLVAILSLGTFLCTVVYYLVKFKFKNLSNYLLYCAWTLDQTGNVYCAPGLNFIMKRKGEGYEFGNVDETVSSAMGKNEKLGTLTGFGKFIGKILNKLDPNHLEKSIEINP